ncbi:chorismate-binding protein [Reichenbachiella sp. MALMAid0571]|uniref:chorismate-binding protein n=1 Tax=Reichenbachiella sp. MALMAid0571 TaxID=3143939 RepID=UPI0032DFA851
MNNKSEKTNLESTTISFEENLELFFNTSVKSNLSLAIWRIPRQDEIHAICQLDKVEIYPDELETAPPGFFFVPFNKSESNQGNFIKADLMLNSEDNEIKTNPTFNKTELFDDFKKQFEYLSVSDEFNISDFLPNVKTKEKNQEEFELLIKESIDAIREGSYQKIVPSRNKLIPISGKFNPVKEFLKLCEAYENAFVSIVFVPKAGLWMGATPELLLSIGDNKIFRTEALAGTQSIPQNFELSKVAWTQKEIEEQALVSRYIVNCFKSIRLREFTEYGPKTIKAGNLIHLKTAFTVDMDQVNYPLLGTAMLDLLHPTSAVCGMPMKPAAKFLKKKEGFDRSYFSGYLGPSNIEGNTSLYVNLRCMIVSKNHAMLFAGAGVTEDSDPESEWLETEMKFQTLLNVIL